jgi:hypothetical protein
MSEALAVGIVRQAIEIAVVVSVPMLPPASSPACW